MCAGAAYRDVRIDRLLRGGGNALIGDAVGDIGVCFIGKENDRPFNNIQCLRFSDVEPIG